MVIAVRSQNNVWIGYGSWFVWRWLTRFPEDAEFRDIDNTHHGAVA
jgi:hypothetical protein